MARSVVSVVLVEPDQVRLVVDHSGKGELEGTRRYLVIKRDRNHHCPAITRALGSGHFVTAVFDSNSHVCILREKDFPTVSTLQITAGENLPVDSLRHWQLIVVHVCGFP